MRIKNWQTKFENATTRKLKRLLWVPIPNSFDGKTYRKLAKRDDFAMVYGVWCLLVKVASRQPQRGILADEDGVLTLDDIAAQTGCDETTLKKGIEVLTEYGWLLPSVSNPPQSADALASSEPLSSDRAATWTPIEEGREGREWNGKKEEKKEPLFSSDADAGKNRHDLEDFRERLSRHAKRDLIWAAGQRNDPGLVPRTREQVLALIGLHGWETTIAAYQYAYDYKPAGTVAALNNAAADWISKQAPDPESRKKETARALSPAGQIQVRYESAKAQGEVLLFTPKPDKCFVIETANATSIIMRPYSGGDAVPSNGSDIARNFGKHLDDQFWTTEAGK